MSAEGDKVDRAVAEDGLLPEERTPLAETLRTLPRLSAPVGPQSALRFEAIRARLDEAAFDARLADEERVVRALVRELPRLRAPASLRSLTAAPRLRLVRRELVALAAAAALLLAATLPVWLVSKDGRSLATEAAALDGTPIPVRRIVEVERGSADALWLERRVAPRGGP